ncbi:MAG: CRISPR-associated endonuclease Cas6 [Candidatus Methanoperedens sp.]|nr:CRISPR-associated endonuclease Cas6 [Candidatus Methanoperedens sp.]MCZ7403548.1 CRISPR-associated endonuclease Cas6 [Candidatus Methanoperedens sp.]
MLLKIFTLTIASTRPITGSAPELRGFFATQFNEYSLLHQHSADRLIYRYPLVQYKMIGGAPMVVGINDGAEVLKQVYDKYDEIKLGEEVYEIVEKGISVKNQEFGISEKIHSYEFATPWLALNQENYKKYYGLKSREDRNEFLRKTLIGNLLSVSKSLDYQVPDTIKCDVDVNIRKSRLKDVNVMTFIGGFCTNFLIPDYLGIGKSVSRGFGTVKQLERDGVIKCNS